MAVAISSTKEEKPHHNTENYFYQNYDEDYYEDETEGEDEGFTMSM